MLKNASSMTLLYILLSGVVNAETKAYFSQLTERAQRLAEVSYQASSAKLPAALQKLDYDSYRQIRFDPAQAIWKDESLFSVQLFHSGFLFQTPVKLFLIEEGQITPLEFSSDFYRYDDDAAGLLEEDLSGAGHAGFRLHFPLNNADYADEFMVFLGASYFRLVGRNQAYGLSGRGLAIDTASPGGEEFPEFREFWLVKPQAEDTHMTVLALLDGPSLSGAYRFDIQPGHQSRVDVEARLFARRDIDKLGVAPLTSMFTHGDTSVAPPDDFRPRVHDSEGFLTQTGHGEWIWHPLHNPRRPRISAFQDASPGGFGLVQRKRRFSHYLDKEAHYHRRPSQWIEPLESWGEGHVELVELPTPDETHDNIVAYWVPAEAMQAGNSRHYRYMTHTFDADLARHALAKVVRTRQGSAGIPGSQEANPVTQRRFIIDFQGDQLSGLSAGQPVQARLEAGQSQISDLQVHRLPNGDWRASFRVDSSHEPADIRLWLALHGRPLSETWHFTWYPEELDALGIKRGSDVSD
ncbi:glucan biosynthesis protein D [Halomonas sp. ZH2S]|uniref:Glucan biosynthesis protein D n=2 Tax=Vreelandella zhuhanensis TaxID=2684210 RepID=A0A7X3GYV5_9GAMM|nr:glucan biosynthesis protein D [Halomonas zhuhanensis]